MVYFYLKEHWDKQYLVASSGMPTFDGWRVENKESEMSFDKGSFKALTGFDFESLSYGKNFVCIEVDSNKKGVFKFDDEDGDVLLLVKESVSDGGDSVLSFDFSSADADKAFPLHVRQGWFSVSKAELIQFKD